MKPILTVDMDANAAYLQLTEDEVATTCEVTPGVMVDLDQYDVVVGVEVLDLDTRIPFRELTTRFHVRRDKLACLEDISPNVTSFVARQPAPESTPTNNRVTA